MPKETVPIRKAESIHDEIERMNDRIMHRAYEIFLGNGSNVGHDLDDWLAAERELVWKPAIELRENGNEILLTIAMSGVEPIDLNIEVTAEALLVRGETQHDHKQDEGEIYTCEFASGTLFRAIHLPKPIDPDRVKADFSNGLLRLKAPIAQEQPAKHMTTEAA